MADTACIKVGPSCTIDGNGDGKVSLEEWQVAHERIFKAMDTDHDWHSYL
jgi:uncharacterized protein YhfF